MMKCTLSRSPVAISMNKLLVLFYFVSTDAWKTASAKKAVLQLYLVATYYTVQHNIITEQNYNQIQQN